jgi:hypothetical protein
MLDYDEASPPVFGSNETTMKEDDVTLYVDPDIMGTVEYRFGFKMLGSRENFEVEITHVDVGDIKSPVYSDDGSPVMVDESDKQKFIMNAYKYFWRNLLGKAKNTAMDQVQGG